MIKIASKVFDIIISHKTLIYIVKYFAKNETSTTPNIINFLWIMNSKLFASLHYYLGELQLLIFSKLFSLLCLNLTIYGLNIFSAHITKFLFISHNVFSSILLRHKIIKVCLQIFILNSILTCPKDIYLQEPKLLNPDGQKLLAFALNFFSNIENRNNQN